MKKSFYKLLCMLLMVPAVVNADEIPPLRYEESENAAKDFTIIFISILVIVAIIFIVTLIKNKKGRK